MVLGAPILKHFRGTLGKRTVYYVVLSYDSSFWMLLHEYFYNAKFCHKNTTKIVHALGLLFTSCFAPFKLCFPSIVFTLFYNTLNIWIP